MMCLFAGAVIVKMSPDWYLSRYWTKEVRVQQVAIQAQQAAVIAAGGDPSTVNTHIDQVRPYFAIVPVAFPHMFVLLCFSLQMKYVKVYAVLIGMLMVIKLSEGFTYIRLSARASRRLHDMNFARVLRGKLMYFDTTPLGRILNRFSGDLDGVDTRLPETSEISLQYLGQCLLSIVIIIIVFPAFLIPLVPITLLFIYTARYFRKSARELKRLDGAFACLDWCLS